MKFHEISTPPFGFHEIVLLTRMFVRSSSCAGTHPTAGWLVGKVAERFTSATPRLFAKFNYRIRWFDGWENHKLILDNYVGGPTAPYKSWVLLEKTVAVQE